MKKFSFITSSQPEFFCKLFCNSHNRHLNFRKMTSFVATVDIHSLAEAQSYEELDAELQSNPSRINEHESGPNNKTVLHIAAEHLNLPMVEMRISMSEDIMANLQRSVLL